MDGGLIAKRWSAEVRELAELRKRIEAVVERPAEPPAIVDSQQPRGLIDIVKAMASRPAAPVTVTIEKGAVAVEVHTPPVVVEKGAIAATIPVTVHPAPIAPVRVVHKSVKRDPVTRQITDIIEETA